MAALCRRSDETGELVGMMQFDFDRMAALAQRDRQAFEAERIRLLREAIDARPEMKARGEQTLLRIEATRDVATDPLESALLASRLMWMALEELRQALNCGIAAIAIEKARISSLSAAPPRLPKRPA